MAKRADLFPGTLVELGRPASPQFARSPIRVRIVRVLSWSAPWGWVWLDVYQLGYGDLAVDRRELFVYVDGVVIAPPPVKVPRPRRPVDRRQAVRA